MSEGPRFFKVTYGTKIFVGEQAESMIIPLWRRGKDTLDIAKALGLPESEIANRLLLLRDRRRQAVGR